MSVLPEAWRLVAAAVLAALVFASVLAKAPRRWGPSSHTRRLVTASLALYGVGAAAWLTGHLRIAVILFGTGIGASAFGVWLSRAGEGQEGLRSGSPSSSPPPPGPSGAAPFDWEEFESELLRYAKREPAGSRF